MSECQSVGVSGGGVGGVGGVECRGCRAMSMCFDTLDTRRTLPLSRSLDTGVGVSGPSVGLVSVDTGVRVSGGVGRCRDRVSECRARAQQSTSHRLFPVFPSSPSSRLPVFPSSRLPVFRLPVFPSYPSAPVFTRLHPSSSSSPSSPSSLSSVSRLPVPSSRLVYVSCICVEYAYLVAMCRQASTHRYIYTHTQNAPPEPSLEQV